MMYGKMINMWIHIHCHCFYHISIVPEFWYNSFITCYWLDLLITVIHLPSCIYWSLCSVKTLLSQVLELRSTNWGFSGTEGSSGAYLPHPANDECYISDYSLALVCQVKIIWHCMYVIEWFDFIVCEEWSSHNECSLQKNSCWWLMVWPEQK